MRGHVQGVGFRPFVYRLAREHGISGYVRNQVGEIEIVACSDAEQLERFKRELIERAPPLSRPELVARAPLKSTSFEGFEISPSSDAAAASIYIPPDYFMCDDCRRELHDPADRRYRYPFINCTQCGPRYTLIQALPYDRPNTSMADFPLCPACDREYNDPTNRRFHAEPVACPDCGPTLIFERPGQEKTATSDAALVAAIESLRRGEIVAVKGIGGYHLMCNARNTAAVEELRCRKRRPHKPFAVMFPLAGHDGLRLIRDCVQLDNGAARLLKSPERPIVLAKKSRTHGLADNVAPGLSELGVFLPYSPLHELLLQAIGGPLVATSGNLTGEPVLTDNDEAARRLRSIVDAFLHHNRPIVRPADDPVYRQIGNRLRPIRIGRGCAPRELQLAWPQQQPTLAVGGQMKVTIALSWDDRIVVSPHIGEMDTPRSLAVLEQVAAKLQSLYGVRAERIVCDAHTGYTTHRWAKEQSLPTEFVWHHRAHASALVAENPGAERWLVFTWDGVGLGEDGTLWGGEALIGQPGDWRRGGSLRSFRLPGGERASREPWRSAAALAWECGRPLHPPLDHHGLARTAWQKNLNCPTSSSAGRLFDAAAALILGQHEVSFEAQGPMYLESICRGERDAIALPLTKDNGGVWRSDWEPLLELLADNSQSVAARSEIFHSSLAMAVLDQALVLRDEYAVDKVGLTGGVFQNQALADQASELLLDAGFDVCLAGALPVNDAGICFGQAAELAAREQLLKSDG